MRMKMIAAATAAILATAPASAATITNIDQQNTFQDRTNSLVFSGSGQSFTPSTTSINAAMFTFASAGATLQASLYAGSGIGGQLLTTSNTISLTGGTFQDIYFTLPTTQLIAGSSYTLFVRALTGVFGQSFSSTDVYAGGIAYDQNGLASASNDLRFAEGTGISGAVPEVGTWAMMMFGAGAIGAGLRRRKSSRTAAALAA